MKKKRLLSLFLVFVMVVSMFTGCKGQNDNADKDGKISISMYM